MTDEERAPGWHPDPANPSVERWWNGISWGDQTRPTIPSAALPSVPMSTPRPIEPYAQTAPTPPTATPSATTRDGQFRFVNPVGYTGVVLGFVSLLFNVFCIPSVLAIIFTAVGLRTARRLKASGRRVTGLNWCFVGLIMGVAESLIYLSNSVR